MPNTTKPKRSRQSEPVHAPKKRRRRGPLIRFRFGAILMIWILCVVFGFGAYMIRRNVNPEIAAAELAEKLEKEKGTENEDDYELYSINDRKEKTYSFTYESDKEA